ncbi:MAG TPA: SDR family oxidoreductase [Candidatus Sulfotelmatobacter sp.]|nr:SDR family oxidoreductase [Candidatus Sulfotelmatobacter sp.]
MSKPFQDQVVVVTGGSTGIGLASAEAFLKQGAKRVYVTGRSEASLAKAKAHLGDGAVTVASDVSRLEDVAKLRELIEARGDRLDVIFANAGIAENNVFGKTKETEFDSIFGINVKGLFFSVQELLPILKDHGAVVLTASIVANKGLANLSLYNASKAAVRSFARSWANDLRGRGIRVNAVSPGATRTPIMENGLKMNAEQIEQMQGWVKEAAPLGRMATPDEIAAAVLFLASKEASYITGVELSVDGGLAQI